MLFGKIEENKILYIRDSGYASAARVKPNHMHGIIIILNNFNKSGVGVGLPNPNINKSKWDKGGETPPLQKISLSKIIAYFNYVSTREINIIKKTPGQKLWQRGFYDRIIRNDNELEFYRYYIKTNPENWEEDEYYCD